MPQITAPVTEVSKKFLLGAIFDRLDSMEKRISRIDAALSHLSESIADLKAQDIPGPGAEPEPEPEEPWTGEEGDGSEKPEPETDDRLV